MIDTTLEWLELSNGGNGDRSETTDLSPFELTSEDAAIVMTHSYEQDRGWRNLLLPSEIRYIRLIGTKHRSGQLAREVSNALACPLEEVQEGVSSRRAAKRINQLIREAIGGK